MWDARVLITGTDWRTTGGKTKFTASKKKYGGKRITTQYESQSHDLKRRKEEKLDGARYFIHVYTSHEMYFTTKKEATIQKWK